MRRRLPPSRRRWLQALDALADGIIRGLRTVVSMPDQVRYVLMIITLFVLLALGLALWWISPSPT